MNRSILTLAVLGAGALAFGTGCGSGGDSLIGGGSHVGPGGGGTSGSGSPGGVNPGVNNPSGGGANGNPGNPGGGPTPPPPNVAPAEAYFITTVYPALSTSPGPDANGNAIPSCASCHATGAFGAPTYMAGADAAAAYATITSPTYIKFVTVPANSLLVLHGAHTGPALTSAQVAVVDNWLNQEVMARGINPTPLKTVQSELVKVGNCMSLSDFTKQTTLNGTSRAASDVGTNNVTAVYQGNNSPCNTCHSAGDGGFVANADSQTMLTMTQSSITFVKKYITGLVDQSGNFSGLAASSALAQKVDLTQTCAVQGACHPKINLNPDPAQSATLNAVGAFVNATLTKYNANQCP